jgi:hypothetical protein
MRIRTRHSVVAIAILFSVSVWGAAQVTGNHETRKAGRPLEITQVDVFAQNNWTADDISVLGFHLGMNRVDAVENARKQDFGLRCLDYCAVCDRQNVLCNGIGLRFGSDDRVEKLFIMKDTPDESSEVRKASVIQQFKGQTYVFFHHYSTKLRLQLLGQESGHEGDDPRVRSTTYLYPRIGLKIYLSLTGNKRITERDSDLEVDFEHPTKP